MQQLTDEKARERDEKLTRYIEQQQLKLFGERYKGNVFGRYETAGSGTWDRIATWVNKPKHFLLWMGAPGTGKTTFASCMLDYLIRNTYPWSDKPKVMSYRYWKEYEFFERIKGSFNLEGDVMTTIKGLLDDDFIFYDDMKIPTDWRRDQVVSMVDIRYNSTKPTVITTNFTKREIFDIYGSATGDRLFAKENVIIDTHDQESKRQ